MCVCARAVLCLCSPRADAGSLSMQVDTLCLEDLHAFIAQALCLQGKPTMELADLQVLIVTTLRTAHLATGVTHLLAFCKLGWCFTGKAPWLPL